MTVTTHQAVASDLPRLLELVDVAREELTAQRGGRIWAAREGRAVPAESALTAALDDGDQLVVVGCVDAYPAGYGVVRIEKLRTGELLGVVDDVFTEAPFRGVGVGEAVMNELVAFGRDRGCIGVDALALPGDRETKNFFESFGLKARALLVHYAFDEPDEAAQRDAAGVADSRDGEGDYG